MIDVKNIKIDDIEYKAVKSRVWDGCRHCAFRKTTCTGVICTTVDHDFHWVEVKNDQN